MMATVKVIKDCMVAVSPEVFMRSMLGSTSLMHCLLWPDVVRIVRLMVTSTQCMVTRIPMSLFHHDPVILDAKAGYMEGIAEKLKFELLDHRRMTMGSLIVNSVIKVEPGSDDPVKKKYRDYVLKRRADDDLFMDSPLRAKVPKPRVDMLYISDESPIIIERVQLYGRGWQLPMMAEDVSDDVKVAAHVDYMVSQECISEEMATRIKAS